MCHRFTRSKKLPGWEASIFSIRTNEDLYESLADEYSRLSSVVVIRATQDGLEHEAVAMQWGLLPRILRETGEPVSRREFQLNAFYSCSETVHSTPTFREAFQYRRCLLPATEFSQLGITFSLPDHSVFFIAGLWESWVDHEEELLTTALLTTGPSACVRAARQHRMPVLLTTPEECQTWMNSEYTYIEDLEFLFEPYEGRLSSYPSKRTL